MEQTVQIRVRDWQNVFKKTKKHNKIQVGIVYKRPTVDLKAEIGWKWKDGKRYFIKTVTTKEPDDYTSIRQNLWDKNYYETKREHYVIIKGLIDQEDITIKNVAPLKVKP